MGILHPGITQSRLELRTDLGRRLTITEMDGNFVYLEDMILGVSQSIVGGNGTSGVGIPAGGASGYILAKASSDDYDTEWIENTGGGGGGAGSAGTSGTSGTSAAISLLGNCYVLESNDFDLLDASKLEAYVVDQDNDNIEISLPEDFGSFEFLGNTYSSIFVNTNSYVTFGASSSEYQIMAPGRVDAPAIFIGAGDNSLQYLSVGYDYDVDPGDLGDEIFRIRFEGSANQDGSMIGLVGLAWELHLDKMNPENIKIVVASLGNNVGIFRNERNPGGVYGISDGQKWIDMYPSLPTFDETTGDILNTVQISSIPSTSPKGFKFVGPGVYSTIYGTTSYVKIDPLNQFGLSVGYDNLTSSPAASVISSNRYDLRLTTGENGSAVRIRPRGEAWIQPFPKNTNQVGTGSSVFIFAGGASRDGEGVGSYEGGNVYLQGGAGAGGSRGSVYIGLTSSPWIFDASGDLTLPLGGDILDSFGSSVLGGGGGGAAFTERTYSQLASLIAADGLTPGAFYKITDFQTCYDQPDYDVYRSPIYSGNYRVGNTHSIVVFATSENTLSMDAWQPDFPNDKIKYDFSWSVTDATGGTAYGRITERIDEWNNRTDYDHREVLFKRYSAFVYNPNQPQSGTISVANGVVSGIGTAFQSFSAGDVIAIPGLDEIFFEIGSIESNGTMSLTGSVWNVTANGIKYHSISYTISNGSYYKNNVHDYSPGSPYMGEISTFGHALDRGGAYNNYIGDHASGFINNGDSDFLLANNVFLTGRYANNRFGNNCYNNTFDDDCTNNTIGNWFSNNITDDDFDDNQIGNDFRDNIIIADFVANVVGDDFYDNSIANTTFNRNRIGGTFYGNKISGSIFTNNEIETGFRYNTIAIRFEKNILGEDFNQNTILNNAFYRNRIGNDFYLNRITGGGDFQNNEIGNSFNNNNIFAGGDGFIKNTIGVGFNRNNIWHRFDSNKVGNGMVNNNMFCYSTENKLGDYFGGNTIGTENHYPDFEENDINNNFQGNYIYRTFINNVIGHDAGPNSFYNHIRHNNIGNDFEENTIGTSETQGDFDFQFNRIGFNCKGNMFKEFVESNEFGNFLWANEFIGYTWANKIGVSFQNNDVYSNFALNSIQNACSDNIFGTGSSDNTIGNGFSHNTISEDFADNTIGNVAEYNVIGDDFHDNAIGNNFVYNTISSSFGFNNISNDFRDNAISYNFAYNVIGNSFYENYIENDFGFGGGVARGNRIGNSFNGNNIGEYFYDNTIADLFFGNTVSNYFQMNDVKSQNLNGVDFNTYGNILSFTYSFGGELPSEWNGNPVIGVTYSNVSGTYSYGGSSAFVVDAVFDIYVADAGTLAVTLTNPGAYYKSTIGFTSSTITIVESKFANGYQYLEDSLVITISHVSDTPSVYGPYNTEIFRNSSGTNRLSYYDGNDVLTITGITE